MSGLVPGIHVLAAVSKKDVDGRDKPGHDEKENRFQEVRKSPKMLAAFSQSGSEEPALAGVSKDEAADLETR
jgi:hypothetical protein